jgi:hypothetical protein
MELKIDPRNGVVGDSAIPGPKSGDLGHPQLRMTADGSPSLTRAVDSEEITECAVAVMLG